jgi:two-component system, OmpR family, heavy metal sensor histidine kinase CusS
MMRSIRSQLTLSLIAGLLLIFVVCDAALYLYVRHALTRQFDEGLAGKARAFAAMSEQGDEDGEDGGRRVQYGHLPPDVRNTIDKHSEEGRATEIEQQDRDGRLVYKVEVTRNGVETEFLVLESGEFLGLEDEFEFEFTEAALPEFQPSRNAEYYQVWDEDGDVVAKSPSLMDAGIPWVRAPANGVRTLSLVLPDGRPGRAVALEFRPRVEDHGGHASGERLVLVMARSREEITRALGILLSGLLATGALLLTSAALLVRLAIRRGLRPLDAVAGQAAAIDAGSLAKRFPTDGTPEEMLPICGRLNELLERLEAAFAREQRFTSDVAHELRTPVAELRSLAEVGLRAAPDFSQDEELSQYFRDALAIATQMGRLVTTLLNQARGGSGLQSVERERTDLTAMIARAWNPLQEEAQRRGLSVDLHVPPATFIDTDPALFGAILTNLLGNAVAHSPRHGEVRMAVAEGDGAVRLIISNTNDRLEHEDLAHMFEPFWRKDKARSDSTHSGIGLSIVATFSRLLDVDVAVALPSAELFQVTLSHPASGNSEGN